MVTKEPVNYGHKPPELSAGTLTDDGAEGNLNQGAIPTALNEVTPNSPRTHFSVIHLAAGWPRYDG
jgi:hypothetical protein